MTDEQRVQIELLSEIDRICTDNGLEYFLSPDIANEAVNYHKLIGNYDTITVYMPAGDCYRFVNIVNNTGGDDRYVESLLDNPDYPYISIHYGNSNTLDFDVNRFGNFSHFGIFIDIEILRPARGKRFLGKVASDAENGWECTHMLKDESEIKDQKKQLTFSKKIQKLLGKKLAAKTTFKISVRKTKGNSYYIKKRWSTKEKMYPPSFFDGYQLVDLEGVKLRIPVDIDLYLSKVHLKAVDQIKDEGDPFRRLVDADIPYTEFLKESHTEGVDIDELWEKRIALYRETRPQKLATAERQKAWNYIFLCYDRYYLWNKYESRKSYLKDLFDKDDFDLLGNELEEYIDMATSTFREKKLGLCFDKDIFEYMACVLDHRGKGDLVRKIRNSVPDNHWDDIKIMDYKGEFLAEKTSAELSAQGGK